MTPSTSRKNKKNAFKSLLAVCVWVALWQIASMAVGEEMLLASPLSVGRELASLVPTAAFWQSIGFSLSRMAAGFFAAFAIGLALAAAAYRLEGVDIFLRPVMAVIKAAPVASYIIICLIIMPVKSLSTIIALTMALPIIYSNVLEGLRSTDQKLLQMAKAFEMSALRRVLYIYFPQLTPFLLTACSLALGLCWKAGIAAEVIGLPLGSIGEKLYQAKIFVDTKGVLAWTVVVIAISFAFEKVFVGALRRLASRIGRR